jgi:hypothetical protein
MAGQRGREAGRRDANLLGPATSAAHRPSQMRHDWCSSLHRRQREPSLCTSVSQCMELVVDSRHGTANWGCRVSATFFHHGEQETSMLLALATSDEENAGEMSGERLSAIGVWEA